MPELPEVETIVRDLRRLVVGRRIVGFVSEWPRLTEPEPASLVAERIAGARITGTRRRGKFAVLDLDTGESLVISLRMTGQLLSREAGAPEDRFVRARISFADGGELRFADIRKFGRFLLVPSDRIVESRVAAGPCDGAPLHERLGPEPLSRSFTVERLAALFGARARARLKPLLLDQTFIAGIGNIYANEALFRARVHPLRRAGELSPAEIRSLHQGVQDALRRGVSLRGASIDDYRDARGRKGRMHREFLVHGREGEPCPRCGRPIRKTYVGGRGTYWCAFCQLPPRRRRPVASRRAASTRRATSRRRLLAR